MILRNIRPLVLALQDISHSPLYSRTVSIQAYYCSFEQRGRKGFCVHSWKLHQQIKPVEVPNRLPFRSIGLVGYGFHRELFDYVPHTRTVHSGRARYTEVSNPQKPEKEEKVEKLSLFQKFKAMYRDYWYVLVPVHVVTSAVWYGSFYYMARTGVDIAALAEMAHFSTETIEKIRHSSNSVAGHLAIAYLLYKIFTPLRYTVTLGGTTISINYLKKWGWIKPIPKKAELRRMLDDKKLQLRKKRDSLKERHELMKKTVIRSSKKRMKKHQI